ncbi:hypothetical protein IFM89_011576 [Coptis chinensis]|uniref:DNA-directed RNA polymerase n=1 Tax=Coptis chinensis TaxID=261450 RepID=A0A835H5J1_9MAGN|nr:hypothetical protein IFM89_011576 [Coptis chinensis]
MYHNSLQEVEIKRDQQHEEVRIFTDSGRILRPLLVVENLKKINLLKGGYNIHSLMNEGVIELVGIEEEEDCQTAWGVKYLFSEEKNAIVAVNVHQGYNQEDSLVMNRASLEHGMFRTEHIRCYKAESGDIVIGKCAESGADHSIKLKHTERGKVQKVILSANDEGTNFVAVSLRQVRSPIVGDKFSSMRQKGVIGLLESQEIFPFTHQGIVPDIVINPHAFPTRQTPGQLLEAALEKESLVVV